MIDNFPDDAPLIQPLLLVDPRFQSAFEDDATARNINAHLTRQANPSGNAKAADDLTAITGLQSGIADILRAATGLRGL